MTEIFFYKIYFHPVLFFFRVKQRSQVRMIHEIIKPSEDLRPFFSLYHFIGSSSGEKKVYPVKAGPKTALALCYSGQYYQDNNGLLTGIPDISVIGPVLSPYSVIIKEGAFGLILAEFTETSYYSLFRQSPETLVNSFSDFQPGDPIICKDAEKLMYTLRGRINYSRRIEHTENFLRRCIKSHNPDGTEMVKYAVESIKQSVSDVYISGLARGLHTSTRTLQRSFKNITGITPKQYAEITRFTKFFDFLMSGEKVSLIDKLQLLGYYDQAHAIRKFKKYAGFSPSKIMREKYRLAAKISSRFAETIREPE